MESLDLEGLAVGVAMNHRPNVTASRRSAGIGAISTMRSSS
jgi:hypothetical protein